MVESKIVKGKKEKNSGGTMKRAENRVGFQ